LLEFPLQGERENRLGRRGHLLREVLKLEIFFVVGVE
jgi:hypothetical protein